MTNDEDLAPTIGFRRSSSVLRQAQSSTTNYGENTRSLSILSGFEVVVNSCVGWTNAPVRQTATLPILSFGLLGGARSGVEHAYSVAFSLEDPHTGQRRGFADLEETLEFLRTELISRDEGRPD